MSTHNIGFYEDLTKIIFQLSSYIIKYAPYHFYCHRLQFFLHLVGHYSVVKFLSLITEPHHEKTGVLHMPKQRRISA